MKICVTGIAGFLGSHLAKELIKQGHEVFGIDNLIGGYEHNVPAGAKLYKLDTANFDDMNLILHREKPEVIYHCACTAYEGMSVFSPAFVIQNTLQNTVGILSAAVRNGLRRFVFCSSMARYGNHPLPPFKESDETIPNDPYAVGKVAAERLIRIMAETHKFEYVIAVPHNIIGPGQKYDDPYRNVASIMINRILQGKAPIIYGDGEQRRSFSYVGDCVPMLVKMLDCPSGEVYNIGPDDKDGEVISINNLYKLIAGIMGFKDEPIYMPDRPREVKNAYCSSEKIRQQFGYTTSTTLAIALKEMADEIRSHGPKQFDYKFPLEITTGAPKAWKGKMI